MRENMRYAHFCKISHHRYKPVSLDNVMNTDYEGTDLGLS